VSNNSKEIDDKNEPQTVFHAALRLTIRHAHESFFLALIAGFSLKALLSYYVHA